MRDPQYDYAVNTAASIFNWFRRAVPQPTDKNLHVQLGVHFEEVGEMLETIHGTDLHTGQLLMEAESAIKALAEHLKKAQTTVIEVNTQHRGDFLDSICDQVVTGIGSAYMLRMQVVPALAEVNESNWSKFVDGQPVFNEYKKIIKGPAYWKPELVKYTELRPSSGAKAT